MNENIQNKVKAKKGFKWPSAFTIILLLIFVLAGITYLLPEAKFIGKDLIDGSGVVRAKFSQTLMSPIKGFGNAIDVCVFVLVLGGFLNMMNETGSIEDGIKVLIKKLKGKEVILIPILMTLFSIGGSTYGMLEETVGFYAILAATMVAAGMDTVVSSAIVLLGAGSGVLGSTVNPFAVGAAVDALPKDIKVNQGIIIGLGLVLWITTLIISIIFVMNYAKKVMKDKSKSILSAKEKENMMSTYGDNAEDNVKLTGKQKASLWIFAITFIIMIISFIPWEEFGINFFAKTKGLNLEWLAGVPLGQWYFQEATLWFLISAIIIAIINGFGEEKFIDKFIEGTKDMVGVVLIIALARGAFVLMSETKLDNYIIFNAAHALEKTASYVFAPLNYLLHVVLSVLVPSSSGLASLSTPIMGELAAKAHFSVEVTVMEMVAANGLVNLFTPTCGAIMGGLTLAKVEYSSWLKWAGKVIVTIAIVNIIILTVAMMIFA